MIPIMEGLSNSGPLVRGQHLEKLSLRPLVEEGGFTVQDLTRMELAFEGAWGICDPNNREWYPVDSRDEPLSREECNECVSWHCWMRSHFTPSDAPLHDVAKLLFPQILFNALAHEGHFDPNDLTLWKVRHD